MVRAGNGGERTGASQIPTHTLKGSLCALPPSERRWGRPGMGGRGPGAARAAPAGAAAAPGAGEHVISQAERTIHSQRGRGEGCHSFPFKLCY